MDPSTLLSEFTVADIIKAGGLIGIIALFFRYLMMRDITHEQRAQIREDQMTTRLGVVEDFQRNELTSLVNKTGQVIEKNNAMIERSLELTGKNIEVLQGFSNLVEHCKRKTQGE